MTLAFKCIHDVPPHLSYVSTLPDITPKLKRDTDELKHLHLVAYSSGHHRQSHALTSGKHGCVHAQGQRDATSNYDLATQPVLFRATHTIERKRT